MARHYNFIERNYDHVLKKWDISITPYKYKYQAMEALRQSATMIYKKKKAYGVDGAGIIYSVIRQG